jgi:hypothetical protein
MDYVTRCRCNARWENIVRQSLGALSDCRNEGPFFFWVRAWHGQDCVGSSTLDALPSTGCMGSRAL